MTPRPALLVFDWDGTIADSEARIVACASRAIEEVGLPRREPEAIRDIIGLGLHEAVAVLFPEEDARRGSDAFVAAYRRYFLSADREPVTLFPGARSALERLARDFAMAVATGKGRRGLDRELEEGDLGRLFDVTRCADEAPSKPHPGMLEQILEELGLDPQDALVIGDTEYDVEMARNAGARALAVATGVHEPARLLAAGAIGILGSVAELPRWLGVDP